MTPSFLSIRNIKKVYGNTTAVQDVSVDVRKGEFLTFLGPSGSGKSTTLYIIAGFQEPTEGDVLLNGRTMLDVPSHKRNIGMVFQRYTLFPHLTVGENVAFPLRVRRQPSAEIDKKVDEMLRLVRLDGFRDRMSGQMSGGQQQRVALARALAYDPPILLMDEPLSALDKKLREEIQVEIRRIHQETGVTILYVTHDQEEALRLSDRIAVFSQGKIDQIGTGRELYENPATRFVAAFIGSSDFLPCKVAAINAGRAKILCEDGAAFEGVPIHGQMSAGQAAVLMLRPERIRIRSLVKGEGQSGIDVVIRDITYLGDSTNFAVETGWRQVIAVRLPFGPSGAEGLGIGDRARLEWRPADAHVFDPAQKAA
jgi:putative spermidine/putrescine transport system ATP-binding protein